MEALIDKMLELPVWVVVGATQTQGKFGYKIWKRLKESGYEVYGVNPFYSEIDGETCYPDLKSLPKMPDCINMVIPPEKAKPFIEEAVELGMDKIWFQPGTFDQSTLEYTELLKIQTVFYNCVLVELSKKASK